MTLVNAAAGTPADPATLIDVDALVAAYYDIRPDPSDPAQRVAFGTSGHRGSAFRGAFNEAHILATTEAIWRYREWRGYHGPLFIGRDTHALSEPATRTALEVLAAHGADLRVDARDGFTPTPAVSHAILVANRYETSRGPAGEAAGAQIAARARRWHRRHAVAQPARRRRFQIQPAQRRPGRHRRHALDPGRSEPDPRGERRRRPRRDPAGAVGARHVGRRRRTTSSRRTSKTSARSSTWRRSRSPGCASASIRWAARPSPTGARSASATGST